MYYSRSFAFWAVAGSSLVAAAPAGGYCPVNPPVAESSVTSSSITSSSITPSSIIPSSVTPAPVTPTPVKECDPADAVNAILRGPLETEASSLCLSFLGGDKTVEETQTVTVTRDPVTLTVTDAAQTLTTDAETVESITVTTTTTEQLPDALVTQTVTITAAAETIFQKRDVLPTALTNFASSQLSSACSCIVIPSTVTVTSTQTQSIAGPQITESAPGSTITLTQIETIQVTLPDTVTVTAPPTATVTQTFAVTTTPIVTVIQQPKICNARGLPGPNAFNYNANFNSDQAGCIASCKTDSRCQSTGFYLVTDPSSGNTAGTCRYYDKSVVQSANLGLGYYTFNDKAC